MDVKAHLPVQLSTTVTLSQEHPVRNGFSGSDFGKSSHRNNGPLEPTYLLSVTVVCYDGLVHIMRGGLVSFLQSIQ